MMSATKDEDWASERNDAYLLHASLDGLKLCVLIGARDDALWKLLDVEVSRDEARILGQKLVDENALGA